MMTERARRAERRLSAAVVALALLMGGQYVYLLSGVRQRAECQQEERGKLAARSDDNQNNLILGVAKLTAEAPEKPTKAQQRRATAEYRALFVEFTAEAAKVRAARQALADGKVCG